MLERVKNIGQHTEIQKYGENKFPRNDNQIKQAI